ncbi:MAG: hypothetical protein M3461_04045, partial [Pseudomonadota bacterium]|nr:hypothetical protein [Pseudomonadota bacterium]
WTMRGMSMRAAGGGRLTGVDAVINAVGILREGRGRRFDAIHDQAPRALSAFQWLFCRLVVSSGYMPSLFWS